ncbi:MAG: MBL fold metallo-hydrolase, partial [Chitinophagaceae bacterium]
DLMVYAKIAKTDLLSGHGDHNDLMNIVRQQDKVELKKVFLVHGEISSLTAFKTALQVEGYEVEIPERGLSYEL